MIIIKILSSRHKWEPAWTVDHQASALMQTPFDTCILDQSYATLHDQILEQPANRKYIKLRNIKVI